MNDDDFRRISQLFDEKLTVSGERTDKRLAALEERFKKYTTDAFNKLSNEVGDFIQENLFPMIEEKADKSDIDRLERKLDRVLDYSVDYESRIKAIEHIPAIAHELKLKKSK